LYRELCILRFRIFREQVEEIRTGGNNSNSNSTRSILQNRWIARTPYVVSCATLYACLVAPLLITSQAVCPNLPVNVCIALTWFGFVMAGFGDLQKSFVKAVLGDDVLVKGTLFSRLRHPNFTGEGLA
jgi:steroid 5-alpha reductase family enzyme